MNTYFTADLHFGHYNIIRHCDRPWNKEDHDARLIDKWNSVVTKRDEVFLLGDFAMFKAIKGEERMKAYRRTRNALNGKIHLILGNHDHMSQELYSSFTNVYTGIREMKVDGQRITLCHYPMRSWNGSFHGAWHLFGHVHGRMENVNTGLSFDVGVDVPDWDYKPVSFEQVKAKMAKKKLEWDKVRSEGNSRG